MSRTVGCIGAGVQNVAEYHMPDLGRVHAGAANGLTSSARSQLNGRSVLECAGIAHHGCASSGDDHDIAWKHYRRSSQRVETSAATMVSPPFLRASSVLASARFIRSVTISPLSKSGRAMASAIPALIVSGVLSHGGRTAVAALRNLSARLRAPASVVSGKINARDQEVYFTATSFWRTTG